MIEPPLRFSPSTAVPHPLGVRPSGNLYLSNNIEKSVEARKTSLGVFGALSEDLLVEVVSYLDAPQLVKLESVSRYMLAFSFHVDLWRELFWSEFPNRERVIKLDLKSTWRESLLDYLRSNSEETAKRKRVADDISKIYPRLSDVYSDTLYSPYRSSGLVPSATWLARENIDRIHWKDLSVSDFIEQFEKRNKPVIITGFVEDQWSSTVEAWSDVPAMIAAIAAENDLVFDCGVHHFRLSEFARYVDTGLFRLDEAPIFVFDTKTFAKRNILQNAYSDIPFFANDLFDLLPGENRPDNAWLLVGPPGASSKWHVDPNATNAWNAIIVGEKKWVLLPPHLGPPPGVEMSSDGFAVRQPVTLTDWLDGGFYSDLYDRFHGKGLVEATCRSGEIMFVPRGWWHCVRNTGNVSTIAITKNYAAESSVDNVRRFLKQFSHCVSGVPQNVRGKLWVEFDKVLREHRPHLINGEVEIEAVEEVNDTKNDSDNESCCGGEQLTFSFWDHLTTGTKSLSFERS